MPRKQPKQQPKAGEPRRASAFSQNTQKGNKRFAHSGDEKKNARFAGEKKNARFADEKKNARFADEKQSKVWPPMEKK